MKSSKTKWICKKKIEKGEPIDTYVTEEVNRGRKEKRTVKICDKPEDIEDNNWIWIKTIISIERIVESKKWKTTEMAYFISSLPSTLWAKIFWEWIRKHRHIESFHYIKDVTFKEDSMKVRTKNAPSNYSILRSWCISIFRNNNLHKIKEAIEMCCNKVNIMLSLL